MTQGITITKVCGADEAVLNIVFVHGLTGTPESTWTCKSGAELWPHWLCEKYPNIAIYALGFPASLFGKWARKELNLHELANNLLEQTASNEIAKVPLVIIAHSLGGLLVKEMLRSSNETSDQGWKDFIEKTKLAIFMATPHTGAALAAAVNLVAPRLASNHVALLSNDNGFLTNLNQSYRDLAAAHGIDTVSYYEKYKVYKSVIVVPEDSADPGAGKTRPTAVEADHFDICKPEDRQSYIFTSICRHIKSVLLSCGVSGSVPSSFAPGNYQATDTTDRRDLLQKMIDADREHEYKNANKLQNKFAQSYYKLGLYSEAKEKADKILSSVEQRFVTHVYNQKICKDASDEDVKNAIQKDVIDPVCSSSGPGVGSAAVLQALYFLTEQCYIRWDKQA